MAENDFGSEKLAPSAAHDLLTQTEQEATDALQPNYQAMYVVWSVAWLIAMFGAWLGLRPDGPISLPVGMIIYVIALGTGIAYTMYETTYRQRGVCGRSRQLGQVWGTTWLVGWASWALLIVSIPNLTGSDSDVVMQVLAPVLATFMVGAMYLQGGALWPKSHMLVCGRLLLLVAGVASTFGPVNHYAILGIGGALSFGFAAWRAKTGTSELSGLVGR